MIVSGRQRLTYQSDWKFIEYLGSELFNSLNVSMKADGDNETREERRVDVIVGLGDGTLQEGRHARVHLHLLKKRL